MLRNLTGLFNSVQTKNVSRLNPVKAASVFPKDDREMRLRMGATDPKELQSLAFDELKAKAQMSRLTKKTRDAVQTYLGGNQAEGIKKILLLYKAEFEKADPQSILSTPAWEEAKKRPNKEILTLMLQGLDPQNPLVLETQAKLRCLFTTEVVTAMKRRYLEARRGGLPRRLLNGHWMWEGSHWSIKNKNKMGSGYESNMFDRIGVF